LGFTSLVIYYIGGFLIVALPKEAIAVLTTQAKTTPTGGIFFWCRYLIDGEPIGSVWMPDEEAQWAEWLDAGMQILVERLRPNPEYPSRVSGTAKLLCDQTVDVLTAVKQSRAEEHDHRQTSSMPKATKDLELKNAIDNIATSTNQKPSQIVRQLCWEAICYRSAVVTADQIINRSE
jgi:hypothetical protein